MTSLNIAKPLIDRGTRLTSAVVGTAAGQAGALVRRFQRSDETPKPLSDPTLKTKVESTIFRLPGISKAKFLEVAEGTKKNCPVSRALQAVPITLDAKLA